MAYSVELSVNISLFRQFLRLSFVHKIWMGDAMLAGRKVSGISESINLF